VVNTTAQGQQSPHLLRGARIVASASANRKRQNERTNSVVINFDASTLQSDWDTLLPSRAAHGARYSLERKSESL